MVKLVEAENQKIDTYINGEYCCTTTQHKTCKEVEDKIRKDGYIQWMSIDGQHKVEVSDTDKVQCKKRSSKHEDATKKEGMLQYLQKVSKSTRDKESTKPTPDLDIETEDIDVGEYKDYNGWRNRETWNVALWIGNSYNIYKEAVRYVKRNYDGSNPSGLYVGFIKSIGYSKLSTEDHIKWISDKLDYDALDDMMAELID